MEQSNIAQNLLQQGLRLLARRLWKWLVATLGPWLLIAVIVIASIGWLLSSVYRGNTDDPLMKAAFPDGWLDRAQTAVDAGVDPALPEQLPFKLPLKVVGAVRLLRMADSADKLSPETIAAMLNPQFEYVRLPISRTERWESCEDQKDDQGQVVKDEQGNSVQNCSVSTDTSTGEVRVLQQVLTWDGTTTFHYKKETRSYTEGNKEITQESWVLERQEFVPTTDRLFAVFTYFQLTPPEQWLEQYYHFLQGADIDPTGNLWSGGGGSAVPTQAYEGDPGLPKDGWYWPVPSSTVITDPFGWRIHPIRQTRNFHTGIDIGAGYGAPLVAARPGVVTFAQTGYNDGYGNRVVIALDNGASATYNHLSRINVREGQAVSATEVIGWTGSTGNSTGPHLHFEILVDGQAVDPWPYVGR